MKTLLKERVKRREIAFMKEMVWEQRSQTISDRETPEKKRKGKEKNGKTRKGKGKDYCLLYTFQRWLKI